jgi:hypothetical protein
MVLSALLWCALQAVAGLGSDSGRLLQATSTNLLNMLLARPELSPAVMAVLQVRFVQVVT